MPFGIHPVGARRHQQISNTQFAERRSATPDSAVFMTHKLDPLLRPRSIAVIGASERPHSVGRRTVHNLLAGKFEGNIYPVNPGRETVLGLKCYPDLSSLPETAEHVAFAVSDHRIETALDDAITHGARAATIMSQLLIANDTSPLLLKRVESRINESGLLVCGANAMGFFNCHDGVWMCGFDTRENHLRGGNVTLISHSGSGMSGILDSEERIDFNLAVSTGQEINVAMHDYMDFAIEQHGTSVIGLFMETVRDPRAMLDVFEKARERHIPIVAIKVGKTALSARLARSHSGAVAGDDASYDAVFDQYGVQRVRDMDEFTTALIMFAQPHAVPDGGLVCLHDSGGERQLIIDLANDMQVPFAGISEQTEKTLESLLDPGLPAVNPLDAWGAGGPDSDQIMSDCLTAMILDPAASIAAVIQDRAPYSHINPKYIEYMRQAHTATGKPVFLVSNHQGTGTDPLVVKVTREGFPVLDGIRPFLSGVNCLFAYRDFCQRNKQSLPQIAPALIADSLHALHCGSFDEQASLQLLRNAGLSVIEVTKANTLAKAQIAALDFGFPVVMKTAEAGIEHKTERGGVVLNILDRNELELAYRQISADLGPAVLVAPMVQNGLEMLLGMISDPQFGPLVIIGIGGVKVEALKDVVSILPPFDAGTAKRRLKSLKHSALFEYKREAGLPDMESFYEVAALFSVLVASLGDAVNEIDLNPVIVHSHGCVVVDALIVTKEQ